MGVLDDATKIEVVTAISEPSHYRVIVLNDEKTTMDFVIEILIKIFLKSEEEAVMLTYKIHQEGHAEVAIYCYDIAYTKVSIVTQMALKAGFPLKALCEKII